MININDSTWGSFKVKDLFDIHPTKSYKLNNNILFESDGKNPVVVNSSFNNGIGGYTKLPTTESGNIITFSDTTSADAIFYQKDPFVGYAHIQGMYPIGEYKDKWNEKSFLFFLSVFKNRAINLNFNYVNKFTRNSAKEIIVRLPVDLEGRLNFKYMEKYMDETKIITETFFKKIQDIKYQTKSIDVVRWKNFYLYDIFEIDSGTKLDKSKMNIAIEKINFVGRSNFNNGVTQKVNEIAGLKPYEAGNLTLALGGAYLGSCFVQQYPFYTGQNVAVLIPKIKMSFEAKQFIATVIFKESQNNYRAFIKELNSHIKTDFKIKLPVTIDGRPDYEYMESYIRLVMIKTKKTLNIVDSI